jgi:hypothetical protein
MTSGNDYVQSCADGIRELDPNIRLRSFKHTPYSCAIFENLVFSSLDGGLSSSLEFYQRGRLLSILDLPYFLSFVPWKQHIFPPLQRWPDRRSAV